MKKNLFVISESEKERILGMHRNATKRHYLAEELIPIKDKTTGKVSMYNGPLAPAGSDKITQIEFDTIMKTQQPTTVAGTSGTTTPSGTTNVVKFNIINDKDYEYKREGDKYSFKIRETPVSPKVLALKQQGKYVDWTVATGAGLDAIKKLPFKIDTSPTEPMKTLNPTSVSSTATQLSLPGTSGATATSGALPQLQGVVDTTNMASAKDIRQGYRQGKRDVRELERELRQNQNTLQRMANKMTPEQKKQYETKIAQLQIQINQSAT